MSHLYDTVVPTVIDDALLLDAILKYGPQGEAGVILRREPPSPEEVQELQLEYRNILKIDGLWEYVNLTKLQLCNNIIEKIEGIDMLVNLLWLDLSFNNIRVIEGLDKLAKLEDLTLYHNKISVLENMDALTNLHVLSVGNNDLRDLTNLMYLRSFKNLRSLNLHYNPICNDKSYKEFVGAFLPHVVFLDYRLFEDEWRERGADKYHIAIMKLTEAEAKEIKEQEVAAATAAELKLPYNAYVENMNGPFLFDSLYSDDYEGEVLADLPGVDALMAEFREKFVPTCKHLYEYGMEAQVPRDGEVKQFWDSVNEAIEEDRRQGMAAIENFKKQKEVMFEDISKQRDPVRLEEMVTAYQARVTELWNTLMGSEMHLLDGIEEVVERFDLSLQDLVSSFVEGVQGFMSKLREYENMHNEKLVDLTMPFLERVSRGDYDLDMPDRLAEILSDKDATAGAIATSHDLHLLKIDLREEELITRVTTWRSDLINAIHRDTEQARNRSRVMEIQTLIDQFRCDVEDLEMSTDTNVL